MSDINHAYRCLVLKTKLKELLGYVDEGSVEYTEDLKEVIDSLVKINPDAWTLVLASQLYACDFNEFDTALELARKAVEIELSNETQSNYQEICRIRKICS